MDLCAMTVESNSPQLPVYQPGTDWQSLVDSADEILGYDLARDETADDLVGVPFVITRLVYRPGVTRDKQLQAYVSCEVRIGESLDIRVINTRRESSKLAALQDLEQLAFGPNAHVVFNDGSTGVYRQMVKYLAGKNYITLKEPIVEAGAYGETSFDRPPSEWAGFNLGYPERQEGGFVQYTADILLYCPRGLRLSLYDNEYTQTGSKTRYIA